jgi:hypothetical protein
MTERDPRIEPLPGDVIRKVREGAKALDRCVTGRKGHDVYYVAKSHNAGTIKNCWITTWREWAKGTLIAARALTHP